MRVDEVIEMDTATLPVKQDDVVLSIKDISKKFCRDLRRAMFYAITDIGGELFGVRNGGERKLRTAEFWALDNVSFELRRGEAVGIIGANGAGKTTLLKIVSGLIKPDHGSVKIRGRLAPLIALGAGFNATLSGKENIYVNMSILGLRKEEIDERLEEVIEFAEIGHAINAPVATYSSGMAARLGFSCAIHTDPEILLVDEVLAVGDVRFRMKCYRKLAELKARGNSFILVSHSASSILSVCDRAVYLKKGALITDGKVHEVMNKYEQDLFNLTTENVEGRYVADAKDASQTTGADILEVFFRDKNMNAITRITTGEPFSLCIKVKAWRVIPDVGINVIIRASFDERDSFAQINTAGDERAVVLKEGVSEMMLSFPYCAFPAGIYSAKINLNTGQINIFDGIESFRFGVASNSHISALVHQPYDLNIHKLQ